MSVPYDALLLVSFGGPEGPEEVLPFLRTVTRGRDVPEERLRAVAEHYDAVGGVSPINGHARELLAALRSALAPMPVFWGNRNWHPFLADALAEMRDAGVRRGLAFVTSGFGSYSGCRQYRQDIAAARVAVGPGAPDVHKLRAFYNHPAFVACFAERTATALAQLPARLPPRLVFSAHSIPLTMAVGSPYQQQLLASGALVADAVGVQEWTLAWQSRSGSPAVPWLEPDVRVVLTDRAAADREVVLVPLGFLSDHMEVVHDLDREAVPAARAHGVSIVRAGTPGADPRIVGMVRDLIAERTAARAPEWAGPRGPAHSRCPRDCCPATLPR